MIVSCVQQQHFFLTEYSFFLGDLVKLRKFLPPVQAVFDLPYQFSLVHFCRELSKYSNLANVASSSFLTHIHVFLEN